MAGKPGDHVLNEDDEELCQLHGGQIRPPGSVLDAYGSEPVVRVHEDVDPAVEQSGKIYVARGVELRSEAGDHCDRRMMVNVQERDLTIRLAQHEEERVQKFPVLLVVVHKDPPCQQSVRDVPELLPRLLAARVADEGSAGLLPLVRRDRDPGNARQHHAAHVVDLHKPRRVGGGPRFHEDVEPGEHREVEHIGRNQKPKVSFPMLRAARPTQSEIVHTRCP